jgi:hypothetical protein
MVKTRQVLVHRKWRTVHSLRSDGTACCGGDYHGGPQYILMLANQVKSSDPECQTRACEIGRN